MEKILCAAVKYTHDNDRIIAGYRHSDCIEVIADIYSRPLVTQQMQGFLTNKNRWVSRKKAYQIAIEAGQLDLTASKIRKKNRGNDILLSEDLY